MKQIHKAAGVIIKDHKLLLTRSKNQHIFVAPGGKLEIGETPPQALIRELQEELSIMVVEKDIAYLATNTAPAAYNPNLHLTMDTFVVSKFSGTLTPSAEIAEMSWVNSSNTDQLQIGSIFRDHIIPLLIQKQMID